jgi:hypothetical protein
MGLKLRLKKLANWFKSGPVQLNKRDPSDKEALRHEYTEVNNDIRNHSNLRFTIFTVYLAAIGGLSSVAFGFFEFKHGDPEQIKFWGRVGGLVVAILFFYYERRLQSLINHNIRIGVELEKILGYNHITARPSWGRFRSHYATNIFFGLIIIFWLVMIIHKMWQLSYKQIF